MKRILLSATLMTGSIMAGAQMPYNLTVTSQTYQPLSGATSINGSNIWHDTMFSVPLGFSFKLNGTTITRFNVLGANFVGTDTAGTVSGFLLTDAELIDRGTGGTQSKSPIRYEVTGSAGNRIFKAEWSNAGFAMQQPAPTDSLNVQIWLYEGSDIVELRYGTSKVSHPLQYFDMLKDPAIGFARNVNYSTQALDKLYLLSGDPLSPSIDSFSMTQPNAKGLNSFPPAGTVYRFTPKNNTTTIGDDLRLNDLRIYPSIARSVVNISYSENRSVQYQVVGLTGAATNIHGTLKSGSNAIDINGLAAGMYLLRLTDKEEQKVIRIRFIKE